MSEFLETEPSSVIGLASNHAPSVCAADPACAIHRPSDHPLRDAPLLWRIDRGLLERVCPHGVGHPDPDDLAFKQAHLDPEYYALFAFEVHGCDGCCV